MKNRTRVGAALSWVLAGLVLATACAKADRAPAPPASEATPPATPEDTSATPPPAEPTGSTEEEAPSSTAAPTVDAEKKSVLDQKEKEKDKADAEFKSIAEAEQALARAKTSLDTLIGGLKKAGGGGATALAAGDSRCPEACKAMGSLRRAAAGICRLAGENDKRCARAKSTVKENEGRVSACKCED